VTRAELADRLGSLRGPELDVLAFASAVLDLHDAGVMFRDERLIRGVGYVVLYASGGSGQLSTDAASKLIRLGFQGFGDGSWFWIAPPRWTP
jgi:hypothetical protein